jgi:hypothetical protein
MNFNFKNKFNKNIIFIAKFIAIYLTALKYLLKKIIPYKHIISIKSKSIKLFIFLNYKYFHCINLL